MDVTLRSLKAWVGEFFTPNQIVGIRTEGAACLVANYLTWRGKDQAFVTPHTMSWTKKDGDISKCEKLPPEISRLVRLFDESGKQGTGVRAQTALKLIQKVESELNEQVTQPEREAEVPYELVGTTS